MGMHGAKLFYKKIGFLSIDFVYIVNEQLHPFKPSGLKTKLGPLDFHVWTQNPKEFFLNISFCVVKVNHEGFE